MANLRGGLSDGNRAGYAAPSFERSCFTLVADATAGVRTAAEQNTHRELRGEPRICMIVMAERTRDASSSRQEAANSP